MDNPRIIQGDNLTTLQTLKDARELFDLVELDGPYGAGLEEWDNLAEAEYLAHYAARLPVVRDVLQPWGVVFMFGYPEWCAEVKAWAHRTETMYLQRWLTWYKQRTVHRGRKVEAVLVLVNTPNHTLLSDFKTALTKIRRTAGLTVTQAMALTPCRRHLAGKGAGMMWFESPSATVPTSHEYIELKQIFSLPDRFDMLCSLGCYDGLTDIDFFDTTYPEDTAALNTNGLRSKPVQLYLDLFKPTIPPTYQRRALILYGGSGNAGIAAAALGYEVTICESDPVRCDLIRERWDVELARWRLKLSQLRMFEDAPQPDQLEMEGLT